MIRIRLGARRGFRLPYDLVAVVAACGVAPDLIKTLAADIESAPIEARMKPILRYARKLTQSPARVTAADAAAVYDAGWNDDALYSTVLVTALFNFYNRLADGVGLSLPEGYPAEAGKRAQTRELPTPMSSSAR